MKRGWLPLLACFVCLAGLVCAPAAFASPPKAPPSASPAIFMGLQDGSSLPARFRNHCRTDALGFTRCTNHCGSNHHFYYCSDRAFGCCPFASGYCDWRGALRCGPQLFAR